MNCPVCGARMCALLTSVYCPNLCDKVAKGPYCPECGTDNTERFDVNGTLDFFAPDDSSVTYHCWPHGHVWNVVEQKPETD